MKNGYMNFLLLLGVIFFLSSVSASYGYNNINNGVTVSNVNQTLVTNTYSINGSNINATSFSTACSGTDKVSNVTYSNFTGLFTIVCTTDQDTGGTLTWAEIINGTVYLSDNPYSFYNSTTFSESDPLWSANFTLYNSSWSSINNATYNEAWLFTTNGSFYPYTSNPFGYINTTGEPLWTDNFTKYNSSWSTDTDTWNTTEQIWAVVYNGTFYLDSNPYSFYNSTDFSISDYYLITNPYGFYNSTTLPASSETNWNANYSVFLSLFNNDFGFYNISAFDINDYYLNTNPYSFYNLTSLPTITQFITWQNATNGTLALNSSLTLNYFNYTNNTLLSQFENDLSFTEPLWSSNFTLFNSTWTNTYNSTYDAYNSTGLIQNWNSSGYIQNWNASGLIKNWGTLTESDPYWSDNFTKYNSSWSDIFNQTYHDAWLYATNGTFYLDTNPYSFYNSTTLPASSETNWNANYSIFLTHITWADAINGTLALNSSLIDYYPLANPLNFTNKTLLSEFENDLTFYVDNTHGYYNSTNWNNPWNYTNFTKLSDYTNDLSFYVDNTHNYSNFTKVSEWENDAEYLTSYSESDPLWSANYTVLNSTWSSIFNQTYQDAWNYVSNGTFYIDNSHGYWNSTFADFNKTYADTLYYPYTSNPFGYLNTSTETLWNGNYSAVLNLLTNGYSYFNSTSFPNYANVYLNTTNQYNYTNFTLLSQFENDLSTTEPLWSANYSAVLNLLQNGYGYYNATDFSIGDYYLLTNPYSFYNSTDFTITDYLLTSNKTLNGNYSASVDFCLSDGSKCLSGVGAGAETLWNGNYTAVLNLLNNGYSYYNSTSLTTNSQLLNGFSFFNITTFPNYANIYLNTSNQYNYSNFTLVSQLENDAGYTAGGYTDNSHNYTNATVVSYFENDAGYLTSYSETDPLWSGNQSSYRLNSNNTFNGALTSPDNFTIEGIALEKDTTNHRIYDNSSCIIIKAGGTELRLCE